MSLETLNLFWLIINSFLNHFVGEYLFIASWISEKDLQL